MDTRAWLDPKPHSVEGHTKRCVLFFEDGLIWGPTHCHPNTVQLKEALEAADSRFEMYINDRPKSIEGHTAYISVSAGGKVYLDQLPTHDNMSGLCEVNFVLSSILRVDHFVSRDSVMKSGLRRGRIVARHRAMGFEMEDSFYKGLSQFTKVGCIKLPLFAAHLMSRAPGNITAIIRVDYD
ncbi:hypothetical protein Daesc_007630 [Daldinia eschscholtzii]|uniref:Uncharacterized protein n=1 Tax=Daldinia eschscholtzii TaxID=292717 RepID=A0AAX6MEL8_9PEZI